MTKKNQSKHWIFLRGLARESAHWGEFPKNFAEAFPEDKITLVDLPGVGVKRGEPCPATIQGMMRSIRKQVLAEQGSGPFHFLSLSLGGMVTLSWMNLYPDEVAGAVIVNSSSRLSPFYQRLRWESWKAFLTSVSKLDVKAREEGVLKLITNNDENRSKILPLWIKVGRKSRISPKTLVIQLSAAGRYSVPRRILGDKALFVVGMGDRLVEPVCTEELAEHFQSPVARHPWAGHDIPIDDPQWLIQKIGDWIKDSQRAGSETQFPSTNP